MSGAAFVGAIQQAADEFADAARKRDRDAADALVRAYALVRQDLAARYAALIGEIRALQLTDQQVSVALSSELSRVSTLLHQANGQMLNWLEAASDAVRQEQRAAVIAAQSDQAKLAAIVQGPGPHGIHATFNHLPASALADLVGTLQDGSPLRALLDGYGKDASKQVADALVTGLAQGQHPFTIARHMVKAMDGNVVRALTVARTETLRAYRESSLRFFKANNTVTGWIWWSARNERTCPVCWAMHGSRHSLDEHFGSHPNCRCTMLPITKTWAELGFGDVPGDKAIDVPTGEELFAKQPAAVQKTIIGPAKHKAWSDGNLGLGDLVRVTRDPQWGLTRSEASLKDALARHGGKAGQESQDSTG